MKNMSCIISSQTGWVWVCDQFVGGFLSFFVNWSIIQCCRQQHQDTMMSQKQVIPLRKNTLYIYIYIAIVVVAHSNAHTLRHCNLNWRGTSNLKVSRTSSFLLHLQWRTEWGSSSRRTAWSPASTCCQFCNDARSGRQQSGEKNKGRRQDKTSESRSHRTLFHHLEKIEVCLILTPWVPSDESFIYNQRLLLLIRRCQMRTRCLHEKEAGSRESNAYSGDWIQVLEFSAEHEVS